MKTLVGLFADSSGVSKRRVFYNSAGLIEHVEHCVVAHHRDDEVFNDDCLIFAGMGDIHIHAREDVSRKHMAKEDFKSCECAAFNGGLVHVADMPNNPIPPVDDTSYKQKLELSLKRKLHFLMYAGIGPSTMPLSFKVPYKVYMGPSIGDLFFSSNQSLEERLHFYRHQNVSFHCEDPEILEQSKNASDHFLRRPLPAENVATKFALKLIEKYDLQGKLCHYSSGEGLDLIIDAKKRGVNVSCEVTPQHLFFSEEKIKSDFPHLQTKFQMNPPIRKESDRQKLLWALKNGHIDFLATDHAPHTDDEKIKGTSGLPGLDTYALFVTWLLNEQSIDPRIIAKVCCENPGDFSNQFLDSYRELFPHFKKYGHGFGRIKPGYVASFSVLNLKKIKTLLPEHIFSKAKWTPFLNYPFSGSLEALFVMGERTF